MSSLLEKAMSLLSEGNRSQAKSQFAQILRQDPNHLDANYLLGTLCVEDLEFERGLKLLKKALIIKPDSTYVLNNLGTSYSRQGMYDKGLEYLHKALAIDGKMPEALCGAGFAYLNKGKPEEARRYFEVAEKVKPGMTEVRAGFSAIEELMGNYKKAKGIINKKSNNVSEVLRYCKAVLHDDSSSLSDFKEALLLTKGFLSNERLRVLPAEKKAEIFYTCGDLNNRLKDYDEAFSCYKKGNNIKYNDFSPSAHNKLVEKIKAGFSKVSETTTAGLVNGANLVFIVGMPRSGSTLYEQILSSHPDVVAMGECSYLSMAMSTIDNDSPQHMLSDREVPIVAKSYMRLVSQNHPNAKLFIDKTLPNFLRIGQIQQVFPSAKILHCVRNPIDTCISCYFHDFAGKYEFTNNLKALGQYYRSYVGIMEFWKEIVGDNIVEFVYEKIIANEQDMIRELQSICGLKHSRSCLKFYKNKRIANTASYHQVTKPIFSTSVNRSEPYIKHLSPLIKELERLQN